MLRPSSGAGTYGCSNPVLRQHMPELDTVRGIAVLLVLFLHGLHDPLLLILQDGRSPGATLSSTGAFLLSITQFGWTGVNLFFVLSGFLITGILLDTQQYPDYFARFYKRRALRILPPLYATLMALQLGNFVSWRFATIAALFLANFAPLFAMPIQYLPLWSLAVEEHFYMLWPVLVHRFSPRTLTVILMGICSGTPLLRMLLLPRHPGVNGFFTWVSLDGLALGALLAIWLRSQSFQRRKLLAFSTTTFLLGCAGFALVLRYPFATIALMATMCNLAAAGLISGMLLLGTSTWRWLVDRPFLRFCGYISYGLYLIHLLMFRSSELLLLPATGRLESQVGTTCVVLLKFLLGSTLAILLAYLSRRSLEEFFLRHGNSARLAAHSWAHGAPHQV